MQIQQQFGTTFYNVNHYQEVALSISDSIVVMNGGNILQICTPADIYNEPNNAFVADFIGESNIIDGVMLHDKLVRFTGTEFTCLDTGFDRNENVDIVVRPEDVKIVEPDRGQLSGIVSSIIFKGVHYEILVDTDDHQWMIHSTNSAPDGQRIGMLLTDDDIHIMHKSALPEAAAEVDE